MNRRIMIVLALLAVGIIGGITILTSRSTAPQVVGDEVTFTDAASGNTLTDIVNETITSQAPGFIAPPTVTFVGIDQLNNRSLTDDQISHGIEDIRGFLLNRSSLSKVNASIRTDSVLASTNQLSFTLVVDKPQSTFNVQMRVTNNYQSIPEVSYKAQE